MKFIKSIPALPVINIKIAADFYKTKLGFAIPYEDKSFAILNRDDVILHFCVSSDNSWKTKSNEIFSNPIISGAESFLTGTAICRIKVQLIDELFEEYKIKGVLYNHETVVTKQPWGTREFDALDLHRNLLSFFERTS